MKTNLWGGLTDAAYYVKQAHDALLAVEWRKGDLEILRGIRRDVLNALDEMEYAQKPESVETT